MQHDVCVSHFICEVVYSENGIYTDDQRRDRADTLKDVSERTARQEGNYGSGNAYKDKDERCSEIGVVLPRLVQTYKLHDKGDQRGKSHSHHGNNNKRKVISDAKSFFTPAYPFGNLILLLLLSFADDRIARVIFQSVERYHVFLSAALFSVGHQVVAVAVELIGGGDDLVPHFLLQIGLRIDLKALAVDKSVCQEVGELDRAVNVHMVFVIEIAVVVNADRRRIVFKRVVAETALLENGRHFVGALNAVIGFLRYKMRRAHKDDVEILLLAVVKQIEQILLKLGVEVKLARFLAELSVKARCVGLEDLRGGAEALEDVVAADIKREVTLHHIHAVGQFIPQSVVFDEWEEILPFLVNGDFFIDIVELVDAERQIVKELMDMRLIRFVVAVAVQESVRLNDNEAGMLCADDLLDGGDYALGGNGLPCCSYALPGMKLV